MSRLANLLGAVAVAAALAACGSNDPEPAASEAAPDAGTEAPAAGDGASMSISGFMFSDVTAPPGTEVTVSNGDDVEHTVTAEDESFDVSISGGETGTFTTPDEPGDYAIVCKIHPNMEGTVTVE